jgi:hypothetical protein
MWRLNGWVSFISHAQFLADGFFLVVPTGVAAFLNP